MYPHHPPPPQYQANPARIHPPPVVYQSAPPPASAPPNVIVTQPQPVTQQTMVINNSNTGGPSDNHGATIPNRFIKPYKTWSSSLCDCFQNLPSCILGACCPCCLACWIAARYEETCCLGWCGLPTLVPLRTKIRADHHIQGSICDDCICMICMEPFVLCQMHRELNFRQYP